MTSATIVHPSSKVTPRIVADLIAIVGEENVLHRREEMLVYECDGFVVEKSVPDVVVLPTSTEQVVEVVKLCHRHEVPFVPRGAGTSLAGGTLTVGRKKGKGNSATWRPDNCPISTLVFPQPIDVTWRGGGTTPFFPPGRT